jgi:hypothetical protein
VAIFLQTRNFLELIHELSTVITPKIVLPALPSTSCSTLLFLFFRHAMLPYASPRRVSPPNLSLR